jgi:hypothetical protein
VQELAVAEMLGRDQGRGKQNAQVSRESMRQAARKTFMQRSDGLQLLAPNLPRTPHIPRFSFSLRCRYRCRASARARRRYQGIDFFLA